MKVMTLIAFAIGVAGVLGYLFNCPRLYSWPSGHSEFSLPGAMATSLIAAVQFRVVSLMIRWQAPPKCPR